MDPGLPPDIDTASDDYKTRFSGPLGQYLLSVQAEKVLALLPSSLEKPLRILEIGAGHGQLSEHFLRAGHSVCIHASVESALKNVLYLKDLYPNQVSYIVSSLYKLGCKDAEFDVAVGVRLLAHLENEKELLREWLRVSKLVIFDFPPFESFNFFYPFLFKIKKLLEKNTRTFNIFRTAHFSEIAAALDCNIMGIERQFLFPMVVHRMLRNPKLSSALERACARIGLSNALGSPSVIALEKK